MKLIIDGSHFNADDFLKKTLMNKSVEDLLQQESALRKETKNLDTSLQMLVYQNYNKFITATDTIKKMKHHVEGMEDEMKSLLQNMDKITTCSETINSNLQNKRDKIERLSSVNRTLKKMQFLLELPTRLNDCIEMKKYNIAVKYYNIASRIFKKNANLSGFKNIEKESTDVINKMKTNIEKDLLNIADDDDPKVQDYVGILIDLEVPVEQVRDSYLKVRSEFLKADMERVIKQTESANTSERVKSLNASFLKRVQSCYYTYQMTFLTNDPKIRKQITNEQLTKDFSEWTKQLFIGYFEHIRSLLHNSKSSNEDLKLALRLFCNESVSHIVEIPNNKLQEKVYNLVGDTVRTFLMNQMELVKINTETNIQKLAETPDNTKANQLYSIVDGAIQNLKNDLESGLDNYRVFINEEDTQTPLGSIMASRESFYKNWIRSMCVEFIDSLLLFCKDYGTPHSKVSILTPEEYKFRKVTCVGALLLTKLCTKLPLRDFKHMLREKFSSSESVRKTSSRSRMTELEDEDTFFNIENMEIRIKECTSHLIVYYIEIQARSVSKLIRTSMESHNWLDTDVPRDVRSFIRVTVTDLFNIRSHLIELFPPSQIHDTETEKSDSGRSGRSGRSGGESSLSYGGLDSSSSLKYSQNSDAVKDVMRIFNKKLSSFSIKTPRYFQRAGDSSFSGNEIVTEVLKIVLKTMEECVRGLTFGKNGFQQLQVEIAFMQQKLATLIEDKTYLPSLVQEVMASCAERCFSATPLENTIVQSIIGKYLTEESENMLK
ncbi:predicted protein [Naegleria gruberi]|uniref:Vacuolar protein sorting-associated protein 51 homolog n=1 Tax=Naegleria gruberi TaxID=5762 RepID=D2VF11_NAEGR|nr:uncharacterized protein NAEGRDRAFT_67465 [Naegleria gruberi]EFC44696.1 predicted protein [Naegleria gruberi]|eukprot:XP_002677440.1 predicted protein [Naegleria gruberi strain NEG-M]